MKATEIMQLSWCWLLMLTSFFREDFQQLCCSSPIVQCLFKMNISSGMRSSLLDLSAHSCDLPSPTWNKCVVVLRTVIFLGRTGSAKQSDFPCGFLSMSRNLSFFFFSNSWVFLTFEYFEVQAKKNPFHQKFFDNWQAWIFKNRGKSVATCS